MRNLTATICLTIAVLLGSAACTQKIVRSSDAVIFGCAGVCKSANFQKGWTAYESGYYSTALREWTPLAKQGFADAQFNLGVMYKNGKGIPQDYKTAVKWYTPAAEQGLVGAQFNLGQMYRLGQGVPQDYTTAAKWYKLAAEQGGADAQLNLGVMYLKGNGVPTDYVYAHMWWSIAASNGGKKVEKFRDWIEEKMTPSQLETAQNLARECVRKKYKGC
jgi:TPR repeat protein